MYGLFQLHLEFCNLVPSHNSLLSKFAKKFNNNTQTALQPYRIYLGSTRNYFKLNYKNHEKRKSNVHQKSKYLGILESHSTLQNVLDAK